MKRVIYNVATIVLLGVLFVGLPGFCGYIETHYTREGVITRVQGSVITVCDTTENEWEFEGEGFSKGDSVKMFMFNNGTDNTIYDDEVINVKVIK